MLVATVLATCYSPISGAGHVPGKTGEWNWVFVYLHTKAGLYSEGRVATIYNYRGGLVG